MKKGQRTNFLIAAGIIFVAIFSRFIPPYNFTAVGAIGLFGAAHFNKKWLAFILPFAALWVSDLVLSNVVHAQYYESFQWFNSIYVYGAFAAVILFGLFFLKKVSTSRILVSSVVISLIFFLITNFGVWMGGMMYPKTIAGLMTCLAAGVPFFWSTLAGNVFFSLVLFKTYEWIKVDQKDADLEVSRLA